MLQCFAPTANLGPSAGLIVLVFGGLGIIIPSPGGMGTYHWLVTQALSFFGVDKNDGFSYSNIAFFSTNLIGNVLFTIIAFIAMPMINRERTLKGVK